MIKIPDELKREVFRFILLPKGEKFPPEANWTKNESKRHKFNDKELLNHLTKDGNYGIACGNGLLTIIDSDCEEFEKHIKDNFPATFSVLTPNRKRLHFYYFCNLDKPIIFDKGKKHFGEARWFGQYAVGPNSIIDKGQYEIALDIPIATITQEFLLETCKSFMSEQKKLGEKTPTKKPAEISEFIQSLLKEGVPEGLRNKTRFQIGKDLWNNDVAKERIIEIVLDFNKKCQPPENENIVINHVNYLLDNAESYLTRSEDDPTLIKNQWGARHKQFRGMVQGDEQTIEPSEMDELFSGLDAQFFKDQLGKTYIRFRNSEHFENLSIRSQPFKDFIIRLFHQKNNRIPTEEKVKQIQGYCSAQALFSGLVFGLEPRVNVYKGAIYYDLCNDSWEAVKIDENGWEIVKITDIPLFVRYNHMLPQVTPEKCDKVEFEQITPFIYIKEPQDYLLFKAFVVTALRPDIPRPILTLTGPQGSSKSFSQKIIRSLIDPSVAEVSGLPNSRRDLVVALLHSYFPVFDNIRELRDSDSDALCRAVSGEGMVVRELYTNFDELAIKFKRVIGLNGINLPNESPDLIDRSLLITLKRIPKECRKTEKALWTDFEPKKPKILGAVFTVLSEAMKIEKKLDLKELPRMADFMVWGEAVSQAFGNEPMAFYNAYMQTVNSRNLDTIYSNTVGMLVLRLLEEKDGKIELTPADLYSELKDVAERLKIDVRNRDQFPQAPNSLSRKLNELAVNFREEGIEITYTKSGDRTVTIQKISSKPSNRPNPQNNEESSQTDKDGIKKYIVQPSKINNELGDIKNTVQISSTSNSPRTPKNEENGRYDGIDGIFEKVSTNTDIDDSEDEEEVFDPESEDDKE